MIVQPTGFFDYAKHIAPFYEVLFRLYPIEIDHFKRVRWDGRNPAATLLAQGFGKKSILSQKITTIWIWLVPHYMVGETLLIGLIPLPKHVGKFALRRAPQHALKSNKIYFLFDLASTKEYGSERNFKLFIDSMILLRTRDQVSLFGLVKVGNSRLIKFYVAMGAVILHHGKRNVLIALVNGNGLIKASKSHLSA